jgi:hypothetical protein
MPPILKTNNLSKKIVGAPTSHASCVLSLLIKERGEREYKPKGRKK